MIKKSLILQEMVKQKRREMAVIAIAGVFRCNFMTSHMPLSSASLNIYVAADFLDLVGLVVA